ncbi:DNA topoisomerase (ATP-hydrolyzing) subunit A [Chlamydia psittaci]|uniref:DNA topoisomerase (ATP-hydrolyzing) subunit A n=1 Tax=Chlamydia psittaci TaxID=83554 RepID=UPI0001F36B44|nr:DNA topoisomerase (ATP-hydrolyzing) subunit A [Chlamydia psittaci]AFS19556.1 DNA gyrase, A subunit [Chlamydia psittaci 84/55]EPJ15601.1 DNA gyrase, A subunit [Chlamydia psittaci 02DC18]EPJ16702.1 DNA gyrase, A subunit [Chlamydia psittaci 02DC22]EPJ20200.1 DNA gyrase, A subunit [Chlamydia psittaci 02DC21]EPJ21294.1 DNA gyrase, A subunit [Chlamydia psittaci 02DC23]EPP33446.1 DNA gyrase, A subunit [Chlamydia psittaci C6/98]
MLNKEEIIVPKNLEEEMKESYLRYSMSVIISRALPDVRDGLKPSQRRILYAMKQLNLTPGAKHRKCAKICGDTSGDYHPHGESVIYPTLVRMAQNWAMRYPLVDGQGNFGSIDGDPAAAMRYTEARLTHSAIFLMEDLDKDTVDMVSNYDETKHEPVVFPSKFPNLLCNGSSGIAVGMATNIPPHNLGELIEATLLVLSKPDVSIEEILEVMPGPDFPTGGLICGSEGIRSTYYTGRGKIKVRARLHVEENADKHRENIILTEMPYNVNKSRLIEQIADLVNDKTLSGISDVRDESDKDGIRVVLELKKGESSEVVINRLYKFTDIQVTFGANMLALDKNLPRTMNIHRMISAWVRHRTEVIRRRTRYELNKAEARAHILEGFLKALSCLDDVVHTIRNSDSKEHAKHQLIEKFGFTEHQSIAILELRLYQLTGLEAEKIQKEYDELVNKIAYYKRVLADEGLVKDIIRNELQELQKLHKTPRRTTIEFDADDIRDIEDIITNEPVIITISGDDYVKRMPVKVFREQKRGGHGVSGFDMKKGSDFLKAVYSASTKDYLLIFTNFGQCYWLKVWQLPEGERRAKGKPIINFLEGIRPGEQLAAVLNIKNFENAGFLFLATKHGVVKKVALDAFSNPRKKGIRALEIDDGDELIAAVHITSEDEKVMLFTRLGMAVRFPHDKVRPMGRTARGVRGVSLKNEKDRVVACQIVRDDQSVLVVCDNGFGKRSQVEDFRETNRGGVGVRSILINERNGDVLGAISVTDHDSILLMSAQGQAIRINMQDVRVMGRSTQGVRLVHVKEGDTLVAMEKLSLNEDETLMNIEEESASPQV